MCWLYCCSAVMINGTPEPFAVFFDYHGACQSYHYGITNFLGCLSTLVMFYFPVCAFVCLYLLVWSRGLFYMQFYLNRAPHMHLRSSGSPLCTSYTNPVCRSPQASILYLWRLRRARAGWGLVTHLSGVIYARWDLINPNTPRIHCTVYMYIAGQL